MVFDFEWFYLMYIPESPVQSGDDIVVGFNVKGIHGCILHVGMTCDRGFAARLQGDMRKGAP
jgi:hypothetical protein